MSLLCTGTQLNSVQQNMLASSSPQPDGTAVVCRQAKQHADEQARQCRWHVICMTLLCTADQQSKATEHADEQAMHVNVTVLF